MIIRHTTRARGAIFAFLLLACQRSGSESSGSDGARSSTGGAAQGSGGTDGGSSSGGILTGEPDSPEIIADISVTPGRGIYSEPVSVVVEHPSATSIRYTLDGGDPRDPEALVSDLPLTLTIDPADATNRYVAPGVVLRMTTGGPEAEASSVVTHTYLFPNRVAELSPDETSPGGGWPENGEAPGTLGDEPQRLDYGIDPDISGHPEYGPLLQDALSALPSISLVTDLENLFDPETGIYVNADGRGIEWERFGSMEILAADQPDAQLQVNLGMRIRGGSSRVGPNPKHAFRLYFRSDYGPGKLEYPLFGEEGAATFDKLDLRTSQNYSWSKDSGEAGAESIMNRDVFSRDLQGLLGQPYTRSRYYHLYLDGVYWGIFQSEERPDADYAATYFGGTNDDYDVVKVASDLDFTLEVTDGDFTSFQAVWAACQAGFENDADYYRLEGKDASGARDASLPVMVDVDNLIDYMLIVFYTGNFDAPVSKWFQNQNPNNFFAISSRTDPERGFVFVSHDNEHTLLAEPFYVTSGVDEDRVNIGADNGARDGEGIVNPIYQMQVTEFERFHPQWLHERLAENENYAARFAARAHELLDEGGLFTTARAQEVFDRRTAELESAIVAESARWGDAQEDVARTKNDDWLPAISRVREKFLVERTNIVVAQLAAAGLY